MAFEIAILGSAASTPSYRRGLTSQLVSDGETHFLVDCGEGTQRQLLHFTEPNEISAIFLTHYHGDHILGIPGLINTMNLLKRKKELIIYGPRGLTKNLTHLLQFSERSTFRVQLEVLEDSGVPISSNLAVFAFPVNHRVRAQGYSIAHAREGKQAVITGDTMPCKMTEDVAKGADLLLHEATFLQKDKNLAIATGHSTAREVAELAKRAEVDKLALTHISTRQSATDVVMEARQVFNESYVVSDFERLVV